MSDVALNGLDIRNKGLKSAIFPQSGKLKIAALIFNDTKESSTDLYSVDWSLSKVENVSQKKNLSNVNSFAATSSQCTVKNVRIKEVVKTKPILLPKDFLIALRQMKLYWQPLVFLYFNNNFCLLY